ncbi:MAG: pitrilysin family protein [Polyangiaceae bacterium]
MRRTLSLLAVMIGILGCDPQTTAVTPPQPTATTAPVATVAPTAAPADPAPVTDGDVTVAYVNGIQVLVKRNPGAELSAMHLYVKGGSRDWTDKDAGIGELALSVAASGGTKTLDKDAFNQKLSDLGSEIEASMGRDYGSFRGKTLLSAWDDTFALLADAFLHPAMPASELEIRKSQLVGQLRHEEEDPDAALGVAVSKQIYKGHPFENRPVGTEASVKTITVDLANQYLAKLRQGGRLVFVTVGDVDPAHVIEKVKAAFGDLPRGDYQDAPFPALKLDKPALQVVERKLDTNYIEGVFAAPSWSAPDFPDAVVAMNILQYRVFEEVRTKRNLSYAPSASFAISTSLPQGVLYVTAVKPDDTIKVMFDEVKKLQNEAVADKDLTATKSVYLTHYLMRNEETSGQASMLGTALLLGGDWKLSRTLPERIRAVTPAGVQAFAKKYMGRMQFTVLGDPAKVDKTLFTSM